MLKRPVPFNQSVTYEDLSDKQLSFVEEYIKLGGRKGAATRAAIAAGYSSDNPKNARIRASELLRNTKVLNALREGLEKKLNSAAVIGVNVLIELAQNGPPHVRLSAAKELVDRGYGPVMSRSATLNATTTVEDMLAILDRQDDENNN